MATKMKVYEIAKSLNRPSKDLIKALNENGFEVKSHNSNIEDEAIAFILKNFKPEPEKGEEAKIVEKVETSKEEKVKAEAVAKEKPKAEETKKVEPKKENVPEKQVAIKVEKTETKADNAEVKVEKTEEKTVDKKEETVQEPKTEKKMEKKEISKERMNQNNKDMRNNQNNDRNRERNNDRNNGQRQDNNNRNDRNDRNNNGNRQNNNRNGNRFNDRNNGGNDRGDNRNDRNDRGGFNRNNDRNNRNDRNDRNNNRGGFNRNNNDRNGNNRNNDRNGNNRNNDRGGFKKDPFMSVVFDTPAEKSGGRNNAQRNGNGYNNKKKNNRRDIDDELPMEKPKKDPNRKGAFIMPKPVVVEKEDEDTIKTVILPETMTIKEFADKLKLQPSNVVKKLFMQGKMVTINQEITFEEAEELALEYNYIAELEEQVDVIEELLKEDEEDESKMKKRPPVICVMGHVDHGKTSLLDAIRKTNVTEREAGGITQHIGAYMVTANGEKITFLDTPGHEAFTSMRMRGAQSTDIAILVVAADDGVMPQTVEAISHAKAAGVEIIVAVNKVDKESANIERVKQELVEHELIAEDWGGTTAFVPVSARTGQGIEDLLEMILLTSEVMELKANPNRVARGVVIEAQLDKGRGPVATVLVQKGTLHVGDSIAVGKAYGKVRAMIDDKGRRVKEATPSTPVEILGLNEVPEAGEIFLVTENDKEA